MADHGLQFYLKEVISHINEYKCELDELTQLTTLNNRDHGAYEPLFQ
jgi:hypothetical protein